MPFLPVRSLLPAAAFLLLLATGYAHEGHDHGPPPPAASGSAAAPRAEAVSETFELVVVARGNELAIYLDRFTTNEPVSDATVTIETSDGSLDTVPAADGSYRAPWVKPPGHYDLIFTVVKDGVADVLTLALDVPAGTAPRETGLPDLGALGGIRRWVAAGGLALLTAVLGSFVAGLMVATLAGRRRRSLMVPLAAASLALAASTNAPAHEGESHGPPASPATTAGRDVAGRDSAQLLPDGSVFVPKSTQRILAIRTLQAQPAEHRRVVELPGRVIADPDASGYVQTSVGGRLSPAPGGFPRLGTAVRKGDVLAYAMPPLQAIDASDMRQRQGELDQQISIVERRLARYETLVPGGAIARTQLEDTRSELQGLRDRRAALDSARRQPEALIAPVDGIIADGTPVAGQIAPSNAVVFHIIDPARLWVEALTYEALPGVQSATARIDEKQIELTFRGAGFADRNQWIPVHFAIGGDTAGVRVGQLVTVLAATDERRQGLAVPRTSVVRNSAGQDVVYEHVAAERFVPRPVRVQPLDGRRVLIAEGLAPGRRVVVQGAELIDHIR